MKKAILVDGNSVIFRAYYATAYSGNLMKTTTGIYTNAVFSFANMMDKLKEEEFDYILFAFDTAEPTKRHEVYEDYKAGRAPMPEELAGQFEIVNEYLDASGFYHYRLGGYEADDIIGTLARQFSEAGIKVDVYSSDKDLLQLVSEDITVHLIKKGMGDVNHYTPKDIEEEFGLKCSQIIDYKAIIGDSSDNIPGIPLIGPKTAQSLLEQYGSLDGILENDHLIKGKRGENIRNSHDLVKKSKYLVTINQNVPLPFKKEDLEFQGQDNEELIKFYQKYELHSLAKQLQKEDPTPEIDLNYTKLKTKEDLESILKDNLSFYLELSDDNYHQADIWGLGISDGKKNYFVEEEVFIESDKFFEYLENPKYNKLTYNLKAMMVKMMQYNVKLKGFNYDMLLASYLANPNLGKEEFARVMLSFGYDFVQYDELVYGKGKKRSIPEDMSHELHIVSKAYAILKLKPEVEKLLQENEQGKLLKEIEMPLSRVLAKMEYEGILVDEDELIRQEKKLSSEIEDLETAIIQMAGEDFNINSPKQLGDILFEKLGLPHGKRTKTGYSTNQEILLKIRDKHPIVEYVLRYRQITKLYNTYIKGLKDSLYDDHKAHTIYMQALTTTGRLSSIEPNLQNIPVRTPEGREIRKLFIPDEKDSYLLGVDYSQIELRVLAHIANSKSLIDAFNHGADIHTKTAQEVFDTEDVTPNQRRMAKAVNFGIIYGISDWGLSEDLDISVKEAENYINKYLSIYPEVKDYMDNIVELAKKQGYVETIFHRRRYLPELDSKVYFQRKLGERLALNSPIQGSAADILKIAMIDIDNYLDENNKKTKILLQVHDELILQVPKEELEEMKVKIPELMTNAVSLKVNLPVSVEVGKNWYEL